MKASLKSIEHIHVTDSTGLEYYGCNQEWYGSAWQRLSGCGPSVATTLLLYLQRTGKVTLPVSGYEQKDCLLLMEKVWTYVTPTVRGVNTSEIFCNGIRGFASANNLLIDCDKLTIPKQAESRPDLQDVIRFIVDGLNHDCPVAFLNLHNGKLKSLEAWHWVTIVAIDADDTGRVSLTVFDGDKSDVLDFRLWYETTKKGGALVHLKQLETHAD